ncbi:hypothetical protein HK101_001953 [Irineochytrium annulatum]|nr:hypothetical protein HK101_001953 [Irineochytrium annulatum]
MSKIVTRCFSYLPSPPITGPHGHAIARRDFLQLPQLPPQEDATLLIGFGAVLAAALESVAATSPTLPAITASTTTSASTSSTTSAATLQITTASTTTTTVTQSAMTTSAVLPAETLDASYVAQAANEISKAAAEAFAHRLDGSSADPGADTSGGVVGFVGGVLNGNAPPNEISKAATGASVNGSSMEAVEGAKIKNTGIRVERSASVIVGQLALMVVVGVVGANQR